MKRSSTAIPMALAALLLAGNASADDRCGEFPGKRELLPPPDLTACRQGDTRGCVRLGDRYYEGRHAEENEELAAMLYGLACDKGDAVGCFRLMTHLVASSTINANTFEVHYNKVRSKLSRACQANDFEACARSADLDLTSPTPPEDTGPAIALLRKACSAGDARGCFSLGRELESGKFIPADPDAALAAFAKSCAAGSGRACHREGMSRIAHGASARALPAFLRGCDLGDAGACQMLAKTKARCLTAKPHR